MKKDTIKTAQELSPEAANLVQVVNQLIGEGFSLSAVMKREGVAQAEIWPQADNKIKNHLFTNEFRVTVKVGKVRVSFLYYCSHQDFQNGLTSLNMPELWNAFYCFVSDAVSGSQTFDEFCSELGYSPDSRAAAKTHRACQRSHGKLSRIYTGDIYELLNAVNDINNA